MTDEHFKEKMIKFLFDCSEEDKIAVINISLDGSEIEYMNNPSNQLQLLSVSKNSGNIRYILDQCLDAQIASVTDCLLNIIHIKNPSEDFYLQFIELLDVEMNDVSYMVREIIKFIGSSPYKSSKVAFIRKYPTLIKKIPDPHEDLQLAAVTSKPMVFRDILNPTEMVQHVAVSLYPFSIRHIHSPSEEIQFVAVKSNIESFIDIDFPTKAVTDYVAAIDPELVKYPFAYDE